jgi:hypothetical protein
MITVPELEPLPRMLTHQKPRRRLKPGKPKNPSQKLTVRARDPEIALRGLRAFS